MGTEGHARRGLPGWFAIRESAARLSRIGVIDVGSNSVRLVVFDGMARSPAYFYNEKVLCGLGAGLRETGRLSPEGWRRALAALHRFAALAGRMELSGLIAVATAAVREAEDGPAFCDQVEAETGLQLHVATGSEEARLAAKGVLLGWPGRRGAGLRHGRRLDGAGPRRPAARCTAARPRRSGRCSSPTSATRPSATRRSAGRSRRCARRCPATSGGCSWSAGSWRAIARLDMERVGYPLKVLHGYEPPIPQLLETLRWIRDKDEAAMSAMTGTSEQRLSLVPLAADVLAELIRRIEPERVAVSAYGLREGLLYRQMPEAMRMLDPLIEACRHMEAAAARSPGFGEALHAWLKPLYPNRTPDQDRLMLAACLLHDVKWRAHPDYRAELCFESVTRANIAGIDHAERVFLGLALLNRYKAVAPAEEVRRYGGLLVRRARAGGGGAGPGDAARRDAVRRDDRRARACVDRPRRRLPAADADRAGAGVRGRGGRAAAAGAGGPARLRPGDRARGLRQIKRPAPAGRSVLPPQTWASANGSFSPRPAVSPALQADRRDTP